MVFAQEEPLSTEEKGVQTTTLRLNCGRLQIVLVD